MKDLNIVFFDGYCNICDSFVSSLLFIDRKSILSFASLQGDTAKKYSIIDTETVTFLKEEGVTYQRSDAVLEILAVVFPLLAWFFIFIKIVLPQPLRDYLYNLIAKNRYKVFGKKEHCRIPTAEERAVFLP